MRDRDGNGGNIEIDRESDTESLKHNLSSSISKR